MITPEAYVKEVYHELKQEYYKIILKDKINIM